MAACSTTRRNSRERSESIKLEGKRKKEKVKFEKFELSFCLLTFHFFLYICRQFAARRTVGAVAEQVIGLHDFVNFARAFVNDRAFAVAEEAADGILVRVAVGA